MTATLKEKESLILTKKVRDFCMQTSGHGFKEIASDYDTRCKKCLWIALIISSFLMLGYQSYSIMSNYYSYPVIENLSYKRIPNIFPAVTFCNNNPVSKYNLKNMKKSGSISELANRLYYEVKLMELFSALQCRDNAIQAGHNLYDMLLSCKYRGEDCLNQKYFKLIQSSKMFNCYTFEPPTSEMSIGKGPREGLQLIFYKEPCSNPGERQILHQETDSEEGFRFIVHQKDTLPPILFRGLRIQSGTSTAVQVTGIQ